ncbi:MULTISPECIES: macro domain-containing protein [unclassified Ruminococcus]|uniref:macro domain-containing protein n=1 Tax=unclassified Ruminococcus TaxID=2608920 RepID=UPI00210D09B9|nr:MULTISPECIES: macro domain-containing protein [unclassified Ruminococcus]MCQ4023305.1 RNase III inhibitor [Ruminococcus sp. zg-924]MCQ4115672.1 RNase III inhibitor [Ruminococcus sp. zg-921]
MPLQIIRQDITKMRVDAIVNTTNEEMVGYSGVDLAVHKSAGPLLDAECAKIAPLGLGTAKITKGYNLDAKYIIHTSGPVWQGGLVGESIILKSCYIESLKLAVANGCNSIAFPLISSGTYGYPKDQVLKFAIHVITEFLFDHELMVYICVFDRTSYQFSKKLFSEISEIINDNYVDEYEEDFIGSVFESAILADETVRKVCTDAAPIMMAPCKAESSGIAGKSLHEYMKAMDKSFAYKLFDLIDERGMTDVECYKKANVDKKTFSKIKCNPQTYKPSKQTAVAFAIALKLNLDETQDLLASAGLTLSRSFTFDKIIRYFIQKGVYDIFEINEALFEFDQVLLGC